MPADMANKPTISYIDSHHQLLHQQALVILYKLKSLEKAGKFGSEEWNEVNEQLKHQMGLLVDHISKTKPDELVNAINCLKLDND